MSELKPFKIPSTGKTVHVRSSISPAMIAMDLMTDNKEKPKPPLQIVNIAGQETAERNYSDPGYLEALTRWENQIELRAGKIMIETAVSVNLTKADKEAVAALRKSDPGIPLNQNDKMLWLKYIAIGCDDDLKALMNFIKSGSEPTEDSVKNTAESFQGNS